MREYIERAATYLETIDTILGYGGDDDAETKSRVDNDIHLAGVPNNLP